MFSYYEEKQKDKLATLNSIDAWAKVAKKNIGRFIMTFERTIHNELENWVKYDDISGIISSLLDFDTKIDSITFYVTDAKENQKD